MTRDLDRTIREALSQDEEEFLAGLDADPTMHDLIADTFRGRLRLYTAISWAATLVFVVLMFYSAYRMAVAEGIEEKLGWQTAALIFTAGTAVTKVWAWMEIHRKSLIRELKQLELRLLERSSARETGRGEGAS